MSRTSKLYPKTQAADRPPVAISRYLGLQSTLFFSPAMTLTIALDGPTLDRLDLSPARAVIEPLRDRPAELEQQIQWQITYPRDADDPRELSEIPEVRLWFVRLDAVYPWLPFALDWQAGELARYAAMLVPHQFHPREGIQYNPEALELWVMGKVFVLADWLKVHRLGGRSRLGSLAQLLGYELESEFFEAIDL